MPIGATRPAVIWSLRRRNAAVSGFSASDPRARRVKERPYRNRHLKRVRLSNALRLERGISPGHDQEAAPALHHLRAALVPARRHQCPLSARTWREHLGRMGGPERRFRTGLWQAVAQLADGGRQKYRPALGRTCADQE